jgi:hypothetical protein
MKTGIHHSLRAFFCIAFVASLLAGCASVGGPRTLTISDAEIARLLEQHGPFQRRLLEVLDVRIQRPTVKLLPNSNRLASELDVVTTDRVRNRTYNGKIAVDYALRYDEAAQAIRMTQVKVGKLHLENLPSPEQGALNRLGVLIAETLLEDTVLYRFKPADLKSAEGKGYKPGAVTVTSRGVEVTLAPIGR